MIATVNVRTALQDLKTRVGGIAAALVSRDGSVQYADLPAGAYAETFGIMCAMTLGAGAAANAELNRAPPERMVIEGPDSTAFLLSCGEKTLLVVVVPPSSDVHGVLSEVGKFVGLFSTV